jgi:hypothetical protein
VTEPWPHETDCPTLEGTLPTGFGGVPAADAAGARASAHTMRRAASSGTPMLTYFLDPCAALELERRRP